jgi:hypothetical protein
MHPVDIWSIDKAKQFLLKEPIKRQFFQRSCYKPYFQDMTFVISHTQRQHEGKNSLARKSNIFSQNSLKFSHVMYAQSHAFTQGNMMMHELYYAFSILQIFPNSC